MRTRVLVVGTAVACALLAGTATVMAQGEDRVVVGQAAGEGPAVPEVRQSGPVRERVIPGEGEPTPPSKAEVQDLHTFAEQRGEDVDAVLRRHGGQGAIGAATGAFDRRYPDIFVSAGIDPDDEDGLHWIAFTKEPPAAAVRAMASTGYDMRLITGLPANAKELEEMAARLIASLGDHQGVYPSLGTGQNSLGDRMVVNYALDADEAKRPTEAQRREFEAAALGATAASFPDGQLPAPVDFVAGAPQAVDTGSVTEPAGPRSATGSGRELKLLRATSKSSMGMEAIVGGKLGINARGCFTLDGRVLVAPYGSEIVTGGRAVDLAGIGVTQVGDKVRGGGGYIGADIARAASDWLTCVAPAGRKKHEFAVLQTGL